MFNSCSRWSGLTSAGRTQRQTVATQTVVTPLFSRPLDFFVLPSPDIVFLLLITAVQMMSAAEV